MSLLEWKLLLLVLAANAAPVIGYDLLKDRGARPVDGGFRLRDGRPLFGPSKTWRGLICSLAAGTLLALILGLPARLGLAMAAAAMLGDLASSFMKRRADKPSGSQALLLDQIPEAALPLLAARCWVPLSWSSLTLLTGLFVVLELVLSRFLFKLHLRKHPY